MSFDTSFSGTSLFLNKEKYAGQVKTAAITLSRDGDDWEEQINQALHQEHPHIQDHNIQVNLSKSDPEHGAGIGTIKIDDKVVVPIIVENFKLAPLDLFWHENKLHPLTRPSLERVLQETAIGKPVSPGQGESSDVSLYSRTQPPFDGKYTYASAEVADREAFLRAVEGAFESNDGFRYELEKNAIFREAVKRIASVEKTATVRPVNPAAKSRLKVRAMKPFSKVASAGAYELAAGTTPRASLVFDVVFGPNGALRSDTGFAVTLDKEASYAFLGKGQELAGREVEASTPIPVSEPSGTGIFFSMDKVAACTEPMSIEFQVGEHGEYAAKDALGQNFRVIKMAGAKYPFTTNGRLVLPESWHWIKVGSRADFMDVERANRAFAPTDPYISIHQHSGRYTVRGLAGFPSDGDHYEKTAELLAERFHEDDVDKVMKVAAHEPVLYLSYSKPAELPKTATVSIDPVNLIKEASYVQPMAEFGYPVGDGYVLKVAAVTDDAAKRTVDSLLSLNFLNPETLHKFADKLPHIEEAKTTVAKLLLASRLGLDIDSRPLRSAMYALDSVERDLRELQNAAEVEEQES